MLYEDITKKILEACSEVSNELGIGYLESVYEKALMVALIHKALTRVGKFRCRLNFVA